MLQQASKEGYRATLRHFHESILEISFAFVPVPRKKAQRGFSEAREENRDRAASRARSEVRRAILALHPDRMLTLTYRENVTDFVRASDDFSAFMRRLRRFYPRLRYVAVPERQKRGAWHWHIALQGWLDVNIARRAWLDTIAGSGNVDMSLSNRWRSPNRQGSPVESMLRLASYLAKYVGKAIGEESLALNARSYRVCKGLKVPVIRIPLTSSRSAAQAGAACRQIMADLGYDIRLHANVVGQVERVEETRGWLLRYRNHEGTIGASEGHQGVGNA
jgi:hypothetical protein